MKEIKIGPPTYISLEDLIQQFQENDHYSSAVEYLYVWKHTDEIEHTKENIKYFHLARKIVKLEGLIWSDV